MIDQVGSYVDRLIRTCGQAWNQFWFAPGSGLGLSLARAGIGAVLVIYWLSFFPNPLLWFGPEGLLPMKSWMMGTGADELTVYRPSLFMISESPALLWTLSLLGLGSAFAVMLGWGGRISVAIAWVMTLSAVHRIPMFTGLAEPVFTMALLYMVIGNSTARFSLDAWLRTLKENALPLQPSSLNTLSTRLLQLHLVFFYLVMVTTQMRMNPWWDGLAVWTMMAGTERRIIDLSFLGPYTYVINALTYGVVLGEWAFVLLVWNRLLRPVIILMSVLLWLVLLFTSGMVEFSLAMLVLGAVFIDEKFWGSDS